SAGCWQFMDVVRRINFHSLLQRFPYHQQLLISCQFSFSFDDHLSRYCSQHAEQYSLPASLGS
ncbi:MAG: hypothetical protein ABW019_09995, partial [Chitinophagaceae bacterium]